MGKRCGNAVADGGWIGNLYVSGTDASLRVAAVPWIEAEWLVAQAVNGSVCGCCLDEGLEFDSRCAQAALVPARGPPLHSLQGLFEVAVIVGTQVDRSRRRTGPASEKRQEHRVAQGVVEGVDERLVALHDGDEDRVRKVEPL